MVHSNCCFPSELGAFSSSQKIFQHSEFTPTPSSGASTTPHLIFIFILSLFLPCDPRRRRERAERSRERIIQERAASNRARRVSGFPCKVLRAVTASLFHQQTIIVTFIHLKNMFEVVAFPFRSCT